MKRERLEELVALSLRNGSADEVRAALLTVERETVERMKGMVCESCRQKL